MNRFFLLNTDLWFILMEINVHMNRVNAHDVHESIFNQDDRPVQPCWRKCGNHTNKSTFDNWFHCSKAGRWAFVLQDVCLEVISPKTLSDCRVEMIWWSMGKTVCVKVCEHQTLFKHVAHKHCLHYWHVCILIIEQVNQKEQLPHCRTA